MPNIQTIATWQIASQRVPYLAIRLRAWSSSRPPRSGFPTTGTRCQFRINDLTRNIDRRFHCFNIPNVSAQRFLCSLADCGRVDKTLLRQEPNIVSVLVSETSKLCNGEIYRRQHSYLHEIFVDPRDIDWPGFAIGILVK